MTYAEESAHPIDVTTQEEGLTKREYFAAMAMQGMAGAFAAKREHNIDTVLDAPDNLAGWCVRFADALIDALNKPVSQ